MRERLQAALGGGYAIERELGGGGMSRVFLAADRALGRRVVVKVVPGDTGEVSVERFQREIQLAAALQQANIVPLLAAGDAAGMPYYTMPFVEGESLRARLATGAPLGVAECVGIARDVARALSYAHARGVVHRDIKPDNVLLSHGAAVVTDFGIAKAISAARTGGGTAAATLTQAGMAIGTPAYMAPEQVAGDPSTGPAADLYAWGCLVFELVTGRPPFVREHPQQLLVAHLSEDPPRLRSLRPDAPQALEALVARCLAKAPADRPASADALLAALDGMSIASGATAAARATGAPLAPARRWGLMAVAVVAVAAVAFATRRGGVLADAGDAASIATAGPVARPRVAVLPFTDRSPDRNQEYFGDGIAETLISVLANVPGLDVAARTSAFSFKGKERDIRVIARALEVQSVLEGSVQRAGDRLRVTAQLVRAADGVTLWSQTFDRGAADIFAVQDEVARAVVSALDARLLAGATTGPIGTRDPAAYDLFLQGRGLVGRRGTADVARGIDLLQQALARDSSFAGGWAALGEAHMLLAFYSDVPAATTLQRARVATERALALQPRQPQALTNLAYLRLLADWAPRAADSLFREAVAVAPGMATTHQWRADALRVLGRVPDALDEALVASRLDPLSAVVAGNVAYLHHTLGDPVNRDAWLSRGLTLDPQMPFLLRYAAHWALDRGDSAAFFDASARLATASTRRGASVDALRAAWQDGGATRAARTMADAFVRNGLLDDALPYMVRSGDRAATLRVLAAILRARSIFSAFAYDNLGPLMSDPAVADLLRRSGHPQVLQP